MAKKTNFTSVVKIKWNLNQEGTSTLRYILLVKLSCILPTRNSLDGKQNERNTDYFVTLC